MGCVLEVQLQAKLDLPAGGGAAGEFAERRVVGITGAARAADTGQRRTVGRGQIECRRVRKIEKLLPELEHAALREGEVFKY